MNSFHLVNKITSNANRVYFVQSEYIPVCCVGCSDRDYNFESGKDEKGIYIEIVMCEDTCLKYKSHKEML